MSNYIDLEPQVSDYYGTIPGQARRAGICDALRYLDSHPEQAPGRTITESEAFELFSSAHDGGAADWALALDNVGITVVPAPEPEPAPEDVRKLAQALAAAAFDKTWESFDDLAKQALKRGVIAPGGDDADKARSDAAWELYADRQGGA